MRWRRSLRPACRQASARSRCTSACCCNNMEPGPMISFLTWTSVWVLSTDMTIYHLTLALPRARLACARDGRAPGACSWGKSLHYPSPAQRDVQSRAGGGGQSRYPAGANRRGATRGAHCRGEPWTGSLGEAFRGPTRAQSAAGADLRSAAVELAARQPEGRRAAE